MSEIYNILVAGGAGFIGSALCRNIIESTNDNLIILDKLTYASNLKSIENISKNKRVSFIKGCIGDRVIVEQILLKYSPKHIFNFAAETHVDNSITDPKSFTKTNISDTHNFIDEILKYFKNLGKNQSENFRFLQVSTDEVYGDINLDQKPVDEFAPYRPSSPYAASKASSDHIIKAYHRTYGFPGIISNCSNNYGPYQHIEKFIPVIITSLLKNKKIPIYGSGEQIREWIYIDDHCKALLKLIKLGNPGENYNIGTGKELKNIDLIKQIIHNLNDLSLISNSEFDCHVKFIKDRLGHDKRYAINSIKTRALCNWEPEINLDDGLRKTINYFVNINY